MRKPTIHVTDHALVRYLERVHGVDVEGLRKRIGRSVHSAVEHGASGVRINGVRYRLKQNRVITILPINGHLKSRKMRLKARLK
jgi:hypothetical protein